MKEIKTRKKIQPTEKEVKRAILLKELRTQKGATLEEVATKLNISKTTLLRYENTDITNIPLDTVERLATYYNVNPSKLMGWTNDNNSGTLEENSTTTVVSRIEKLAKEKRTTLKTIEKKVGLQPNEILSWDDESPTIDKIQKIAILLDSSTKYIMTGSAMDPKVSMIARKAENLSDEQLDLIDSMIEQMFNKKTKG